MTILILFLFPQKENVLLFPCAWPVKQCDVERVDHGALVSKVSLYKLYSILIQRHWPHGAIPYICFKTELQFVLYILSFQLLVVSVR